MNSNRKQKKVILIALVISVLGISMGYAAFSSVLKISSTAQVTPDSSTFKVAFSNKIDGIDEGEVVPVKTPSTLTTTNAKIDNTFNPTISNLKATFTEPGQKAVYSFYVYNAGQYEAYLNNITYLNEKVCTAKGDANQGLVDNACNDIKMTVQIGNVTTDKTKTNIIGETLASQKGKQITITLEYLSGGDWADGPFSVSFGLITLHYATAEGQTAPEFAKCTLISGDLDTYGSEVECGTESFYVVPDHDNAPEGTVSLLAKYNLNVGDAPMSGTIGIQNSEAVGMKIDSDGIPDFSNCNFTMEDYANIMEGSEEEQAAFIASARCGASVAFSNTYYWDGVEPGTFVYNSNSILYSYVQNYKNYLYSNGISIVDATLLSINQIIPFVESEIPSWLASTSYWTGTVVDSTTILAYDGVSFNTIEFITSMGPGVRPVIIISEKDIKGV